MFLGCAISTSFDAPNHCFVQDSLTQHNEKGKSISSLLTKLSKGISSTRSPSNQ